MPECPLQHWMDRQLGGPLSRQDFPALVRSFHLLASDAPEGFGGWAHWAQGGAVAAAREDSDGVRRSCAGCHDSYRERYRKTIRARPFPPADLPAKPSPFTDDQVEPDDKAARAAVPPR